MSYAQPNRTPKQNVTFIDDLPDLEELESQQHSMHGIGQFQQSSNIGPGPIPDKYKKYIRSPMNPPLPESGMNPTSYQSPPEYFSQQQSEHMQQPDLQHQQKTLGNSLTCLQVHDHIQSCPICGRFFKNDNTMYIIAIVILAIICILLLKRVLDV